MEDKSEGSELEAGIPLRNFRSTQERGERIKWWHRGGGQDSCQIGVGRQELDEEAHQCQGAVWRLGVEGEWL